jgi:hypothetical protein
LKFNLKVAYKKLVGQQATERGVSEMMFKKYLIDKILNGTKTMTSRDKPMYKVGAVTNLMECENT